MPFRFIPSRISPIAIHRRPQLTRVELARLFAAELAAPRTARA